MTAVVPATTEGSGATGPDGAPEGATTLTVAQRRWCIGAAVAVMGLASLGTAIYQTNASDVDPASSDAIAPLETSSSPAAAPPAAGLQGTTALPGGLPDPGLGAFGAPAAGGLPPLSLLPSQGAAAAMPPSAYGAATTRQQQSLADPAPALAPQAALPSAGATTPSTGLTRSGLAPSGTAAAAGTYKQTGTPGVVEVMPGQAPPPGYRRVYPGAPRTLAPAQQRTYQQRTTPSTTPGYSATPYSATPYSATPYSGSTTAPSGAATTPPASTAPANRGLLGGLGG